MELNIYKEISAIPTPYTPDAIYIVRVGTGFSLFVSDTTGGAVFELNASPSKVNVLSQDPSTPQVGDNWLMEYNTTDGEVIGLGLLFTYVEPTTLEAHFKVKGTNEVITIN